MKKTEKQIPHNDENHFISFLSDYGFKVTFGNESNTLFLRRALQALIESDTPITKIIFEKIDFPGMTKESRAGLYDLTCTDSLGNSFIVEMQAGPYPNFIHRMKFYALQKLNIMVKKGDYFYENLKPIYCIGFLAKNIFEFENYYNFGTLTNQFGQIMDKQISYITIELDKFHLTESEINTDLEKLIFTMKNLETSIPDSTEPLFFKEEWLRSAIKELDVRSFTADQYYHYNRMLMRQATLIHAERAEFEAVKAEGKAEGRVEGIEKNQRDAVINALKEGLPHGLIAKIQNVSLDFILEIEKELNLR